MDIKERLTELLIKVFKPIIRLLLRHGISYKAAAEVLKWCYVDVAHREFGINNKKANKSRIAVITGLTWIDVKNLVDNEPALMNVKPEEFHRALKVLTGWTTDSNFIDVDGKTREIPIYSTGEKNDVSFEALVEHYSGGATIRSILDDLLDHEAVEKTSKNSVKMLRSYFLCNTEKSEKASIDIMAMCTNDLLNTINHNITTSSDDYYFQRYSQQKEMPVQYIPLVETFIRERSQKLANEVDTFMGTLVQQNVESDEDLGKVDRLGLGMYYFQGKINSKPKIKRN